MTERTVCDVDLIVVAVTVSMTSLRKVGTICWFETPISLITNPKAQRVGSQKGKSFDVIYFLVVMDTPRKVILTSSGRSLGEHRPLVPPNLDRMRRIFVRMAETLWTPSHKISEA